MTSSTPSTKRIEDERLLKGQGRFADDIHLPGLLESCVVRSIYAHARIVGIKTEAARAVAGVVAVWTYTDLEGKLTDAMPMIVDDPVIIHRKTSHVLAKDKVRYVGEPVVFIVAENRYVAEDAAELVEIEYEPLPVVDSLATAITQNAPQVHPDIEGNLAGRDTVAFGDVEAAIGKAHLVIRERFEMTRGSAQYMECRTTVAQYDPALRQLTVWDTTQFPASVRNLHAYLFDLPQEHVRVVAGDIGGGFGAKAALYAEQLLVPYAALRLGRPVKWVEDRRETFIGTTSEREQIHEVVAAVDRNGRLLALKDHFYYESGAYIPYGVCVARNTLTHLPLLYVIPNMHITFEAIFTNKMFVSPYRGAGRNYAVFVTERIMDRIAAEMGLDPAEVRRRNLIPPEKIPFRYSMPYWDGGPLEYDSGDFPVLLSDALERIEYEQVRAQQSQWWRTGRYVGVGVAVYSEVSGLGPYEGARACINSDGRITVFTVAGSQGQGTETMLAEQVARRLGVSPGDVTVSVGDTSGFKYGVGTFASRGAVNVGNAAAIAADRLVEQVKRWAALSLEASPDDLEVTGGKVRVKRAPFAAVELRELAMQASPFRGRIGMEPATFRPGLEGEGYFNPPQSVIGAGAHACVVEVDPDTGMIRILKYAATHDCGRILNHIIVDGQVLGGIAQGIGGAFYENLVYADNGQLLTATYMDYLLPTAVEVPDIILSHHESPSPYNPLGVKGVGEGGVLPGHALIAAAIEDALRPLGIRIRKMPLSPSTLRDLVRAARQSAGAAG